MASRRRAGRPAGESRTREDILAAARVRFAETGYDRTSLRGVAAAAGVDVALVSHYFGSKQRLFAEAAELPVDPAEAVPRVLSGPREEIGRRLAERVLDVLGTPEGQRRVVALIRAAASEEDAAAIVRERITRELLMPLATGLGLPDAPLRAALMTTQVVGLVMSRHIVQVDPLPGTDRAVLVDALAPTLQRYLAGDLTAG
ncbi:TetR family transcriptional regulator [Actinacidiphila sp. DG2A-62]|jgi:AcrR family transcriptional regulator|uniref:TetR/AcrR family transcriptional regulator n=1 Tax=Actinacidiphila sp. DG2A-62 TaxID=3108821 RepID=UPI002DBB2C4E|nr:TetR family transcriptional regulator [Actinacidiphila sp. DG2A-62]MEC3996471.1 TetR family transcriptional regulator [Actinacidiphila sp. DG2A-62]